MLRRLFKISYSLSNHHSVPVSGLILQSDILFHLRNHIFPCRGFSVNLRSKPGLQPSLVPTVEEQQDGHWPCKILANPRWSFLPSPLLYFLILPSSAQFCANIFSLVRRDRNLHLQEGMRVPSSRCQHLEAKEQVDLRLTGFPIWRFVLLDEIAGTFFPLLLAECPQLSL